jgi:PadR family transcriptional regulator, regulatory protein AphA
MTDEIQLTPTSYVVLGMLSMHVGEASPYDLKRMVAASVGQFWTLPHAQLYSEPARLARGGYVTETREPHGRRRKLYSLTDTGREALDDWLHVLTPEPYVLRDLALLKLFFGADGQALANGQIAIHRQKLAEHEALAAHDPGSGRRGPWEALKLGIRHHRESVAFWEEQAQPSKRHPERK